jgi:hypothetical protein
MAEGPSAFPLVKELMLVNQLGLSGVSNKADLHAVVYLSQEFDEPEEK